mmetsp:Transcript_36848/g.115336  ORF Transcript_36848/g.115336 Transcript_36848/m.115336 type:complete len:469 (-) Transcript_36848:1931-3337(-)
MTSSPRPMGTSSRKTSVKCPATPRKVRRMASSFCWSSARMRSSIFCAPSSSSALRSSSASRCSAKLTYWSSAFLFTWLYFLRSFCVLRSRVSSCFAERSPKRPSSAAGTVPTFWILRMFSSRFSMSAWRREMACCARRLISSTCSLSCACSALRRSSSPAAACSSAWRACASASMASSLACSAASVLPLLSRSSCREESRDSSSARLPSPSPPWLGTDPAPSDSASSSMRFTRLCSRCATTRSRLSAHSWKRCEAAGSAACSSATVCSSRARSACSAAVRFSRRSDPISPSSAAIFSSSAPTSARTCGAMSAFCRRASSRFFFSRPLALASRLRSASLFCWPAKFASRPCRSPRMTVTFCSSADARPVSSACSSRSAAASARCLRTSCIAVMALSRCEWKPPKSAPRRFTSSPSSVMASMLDRAENSVATSMLRARSLRPKTSRMALSTRGSYCSATCSSGRTSADSG